MLIYGKDLQLLSTLFAVPLEPLSPRIRNVTSRWIELTWQPPSNADSLGNDLLGYRVYVEELCDHHTSHQYRRLRQREAAAAAAASDGTAADLVPQRMGKCREISPETVHGASSLMASFHNLGNYIYYSFLNMILKDTIYIILDLQGEA